MSKIRFLFVGATILHLLSLFFDTDVGNYSLAVAPLAIGALAAAGGSILNTALSQETSKRNFDYQLSQQKQLMDYEWKHFNSPAAQAKGLAEAGLNPAVVFGQGSISQAASPNASLPSWSPVDVGLSGSDLSQAILALSQAKKVGAETIGQDIENEINQRTMLERIKSIGKQNNYTDSQIELLQRQCGNIEGQNSKLQEEINILRKQGVKLDFDNEHLKDFFNAAMRQYADKHIDA